MASSNIYDIIWPTWFEKKEPTEMLMRAAIKEFSAKCSSLSFFDDEYELFKAASWFKQDRIPRQTSFAAQALLSTDVFVVLDTKEVRLML